MDPNNNAYHFILCGGQNVGVAPDLWLRIRHEVRVVRLAGGSVTKDRLGVESPKMVDSWKLAGDLESSPHGPLPGAP